MFDKWTMQGLLDDLDTVELLEFQDHGRLLSEITQKQEQLYLSLGVEPPSL